MRCSVAICAALTFCALSQQRPRPAPPNEFEIGRHTFIDVGPPNDYYEVLIVRPSDNGSTIERILLTPATDACFAPAKVEITSAALQEPPTKLLGSTNPCTIPEKELQRELKRRKNYLVFSGANVVMQTQCGSQTRLIHADILDRDMFDPAPNTPQHTAWTMRLLEKLDNALGPGVMDKPIFQLPTDQVLPAPEFASPVLLDLKSGKYDALFSGAPDKPSDLYEDSQKVPPTPTVQLLASAPFSPDTFVAPNYPPLARAAHIEGPVSFSLEIDGNGTGINLAFDSGNPLLRGIVTDLVKDWTFPKDAMGQQIHATIQFNLNCPARAK